MNAYKNKELQHNPMEKVSPLADKAVRVLAKSIYQTLKEEGCQHKDIIGVSSQLIGLVTSAMEDKGEKR
jgi:hypothetical protein